MVFWLSFSVAYGLVVTALLARCLYRLGRVDLEASRAAAASSFALFMQEAELKESPMSSPAMVGADREDVPTSAAFYHPDGRTA